MKRAVIFYGGFLSKSGGAFFHARNLEVELCRLGWTVEIITLDNLPAWCRYLPHAAERIINAVYAPFGVLYKTNIIKLLYRLFFNHKADLRIFEEIYLTWDSKIPSISILHAVWSDNLQAFSISDMRQKKFRHIEAHIINKIAHPVVTVSYPYRDYIIKEHLKDLLTKKIAVVELGIDQSKFSSTCGMKRSAKSIVYSGALEARKNVFFLLDVFKQLYEIDSDYKLTIIGNGPDRAGLIAFTAKNNLPVNFLGRMSNDEVISELYNHSIYLHTSVKESFSYSLLEAKMAGLKTCAYAKLQVPSEFIDVGFATFSVNEWCRGIIHLSPGGNNFDGNKYTGQRMTQSTLNLLKY